MPVDFQHKFITTFPRHPWYAWMDWVHRKRNRKCNTWISQICEKNPDLFVPLADNRIAYYDRNNQELICPW